MYERLLRFWIKGATAHELADYAGLTVRAMSFIVMDDEWYAAAEYLRPKVERERTKLDTRLANLAAEAVEDRLRNGDAIVHEGVVTGTKPISARDATAIYETFTERSEKTQRKIAGVGESTSADALTALFRIADALVSTAEATSKLRQRELSVIDVTAD